MSGKLPANDYASAAPSVSVVVPAYNAAHFIGEAIESALAQTYPVKEIIVVDDGSKDDCKGALGAYAGSVRYLRIDNSGAARARNVGIDAASGDLVAFLDADDVWDASKLAQQVARMSRVANCALVYCGKSLMDAYCHDLGPFEQREFPQGDILRALIGANHISSASTVLVRRDVLTAVGGFNEGEQFRNCQDYELWLRIAARFNIAAVPEPLVRYRVHSANATRNMGARYTGLLAALKSITADLAAMKRFEPDLQQLLRERATQIHEEFARGFLYARQYERAREAAHNFAEMATGRQPIKFLALRFLPAWCLEVVHGARRLLRPTPRVGGAFDTADRSNRGTRAAQIRDDALLLANTPYLGASGAYLGRVDPHDAVRSSAPAGACGAAPSVSVVVPAYNAAHFIGEAIESALAQTYPVKEIIVVDDGSKDDCKGALGAYAGSVRYLRIDNSGAARARNVGIDAASGDLVAFLDADDVWDASKLTQQVARMSRVANCALVYCGKSLIDASGHDLGPFGQREFPQGYILRAMIGANHISSASTVLVRRDVLTTVGGFNEGGQFRNCEDYELWLRIAARFNIAAVPEPLVRYRVHSANATRNMGARYTGLLAALKSITADLAAMKRFEPDLQQLLRERATQIHEEFARGFLYARQYERAREAARNFAKMATGPQPVEFLALRFLPAWCLEVVRGARRLLRTAS